MGHEASQISWCQLTYVDFVAWHQVSQHLTFLFLHIYKQELPRSNAPIKSVYCSLPSKFAVVGSFSNFDDSFDFRDYDVCSIVTTATNKTERRLNVVNVACMWQKPKIVLCFIGQHFLKKSVFLSVFLI